MPVIRSCRWISRITLYIQYPPNKNVSTCSYDIISNIQCNLSALFSNANYKFNMNQHRYLIIVISLFLFCLISCSEDLSTFEEIEVITERPEVLVNAEIIGLVVNNNQDPIPDAIVSINNMEATTCLLYTSPSPRDKRQSRMPSSA